MNDTENNALSQRGTGSDRMSTTSPFHDLLARIARANPWTWIAVLYVVQALGAVLVSVKFRIALREVAPAVFLLCVGAAHASICSRRSRFADVGRLHYWLPAGIYAAFIYVLSHRSFSGVVMSFSSNSFHPVEYATLGIFLCWTFYPILSSRGTFHFFLRILLIGLIIGIGDEIHQAFVPGRAPSFVDLVLDTIGLCVGCGVFFAGIHVHGSLKKFVRT